MRGRFEDVAGAVDVGAIELARVPGPQTVIGGDVIDTSRARHRGAERVAVEQIALGDLDAAAFEGPPVAPRAHEHAHGAAIGEKLADEIGADEPGPPRDERVHQRGSCSTGAR